MPKKKHTQKQKQAQLQQVVVNIRESKRQKKQRRRRRRPSPEQQELALQRQEHISALSRIMPSIQYNFPPQSNFGPFEAGQALIPAFKAAISESIQEAIPIMRPKKLNERQTIIEEDTGPKIPIFDKKKPLPEDMDIPMGHLPAMPTANMAVPILQDKHTYTNVSDPLYEGQRMIDVSAPELVEEKMKTKASKPKIPKLGKMLEEIPETEEFVFETETQPVKKKSAKQYNKAYYAKKYEEMHGRPPHPKMTRLEIQKALK